MTRPKGKKQTKIAMSFSNKQIEIIDKTVQNGIYGDNRATVLKQVILDWIKTQN